MSRNKPILDVGTRVFAAKHTQHDEHEQEEEAGDGHVDPVHSKVAHNGTAVEVVVNANAYTNSINDWRGELDAIAQNRLCACAFGGEKHGQPSITYSEN